MAFRAIKKQYEQVMDQVRNMSTDNLIQFVQNLNEKPIEDFFINYYRSMARIGMIWRDHFKRNKDIEDDFALSDFERFLENTALLELNERIGKITATTRNEIIKRIKEQVAFGFEEGLGVPEVQRNILSALGESLGKNARARARAIAQTELINGSNRATMHAADQTGLEFRKFWSTSGLPRIRDSHMFAEQWSNERGGIQKDAEFNMGNGNWLLHPGDPSGPPEEVINCRCTLLIEMI
jgi:hypothetical protein